MYLRKTWKAGRTVEVKKTFSARYGKKLPRAGNVLETSKAQEKVNRQKAIDELRRIINANFAPGDWHAVFTYPQDVPPAQAQAKETWQIFLRKLRALYKKHNAELRYVHVTEYHNKRIHHHAVLPNLQGNMLPVKRLWKEILSERFYTKEERERGEPIHLRFPWSPLDDSGQYGALAEYLIKETERTRKTPDAFSKRRYCCSRNIVHPKPVVELITAKEWRKDPPDRSGHYIDKRESFNGVSDENGMAMQVTIYVKVSRAVKMRN